MPTSDLCPVPLPRLSLALLLAAGCSGSGDVQDQDNPFNTGGASNASLTNDASSVTGGGGATSMGTTLATATTVGPTTAGPTTAGPTTAGPTTAGPATAGSTTGGSTTGGPTTGGNTTGGVTSGGPTTGGGTTGATTSGGSGGTTGGVGGSGSATTTASTTTGGTVGEPDCNAVMPTGGETHSGNGVGGQGNLAWDIWSNQNNGANGSLTTFAGVPAFRAAWDNAGGYLGRMGYEWGNNGDPYTAHGTISAQFVANKEVGSGNGGGQYSYIGMYGWTTNPCVEWYVVDDTFKTLPFNPGGTVDKGTIDLDGGTYQVYTRDTTGTGGSRCGNASNWIQYYSIRTTPRSCGVISLSRHFEEWEAKGMSMEGNLLEAKILAEVGGDAGAVNFPVANVTVSQ